MYPAGPKLSVTPRLPTEETKPLVSHSMLKRNTEVQLDFDFIRRLGLIRVRSLTARSESLLVL